MAFICTQKIYIDWIYMACTKDVICTTGIFHTMPCLNSYWALFTMARTTHAATTIYTLGFILCNFQINSHICEIYCSEHMVLCLTIWFLYISCQKWPATHAFSWLDGSWQNAEGWTLVADSWDLMAMIKCQSFNRVKTHVYSTTQ